MLCGVFFLTDCYVVVSVLRVLYDCLPCFCKRVWPNIERIRKRILGGVYVPYIITCVPGGVLSDAGLGCCVPAYA